MEHISSRKNQNIQHMKQVANDKKYRQEVCEYICCGAKVLKEAIRFGAKVKMLLCLEGESYEVQEDTRAYTTTLDILQSVSPLKSFSGPLFTVEIPTWDLDFSHELDRPMRVLVLENLQDPGNVGTVLRTADGFSTDLVILVGDCADVYNPKTVRATMGAIFRQRVCTMSMDELKSFLDKEGLKLYGAALSDTAYDLKEIEVINKAFAIGSEGRGLSKEFLDICHGQVIIDMSENTESLNAGVAAAIIMWEMKNS